MTKLVQRLYVPEQGRVLVDGTDLALVDPAWLRRQIGVVLQNGQLMAGDIFSNIVGASRLGMDDAWEAVRLAGMEEDLRSMPMGMHTVISEGAETFSGGQKQRLLIARAIVTRPRIILFDEATSALDNRTQEIVSRSLEGLKATRIVIAHRLSTIALADVIVVIEDGTIAAQGSHDELLERSDLYREIVEKGLPDQVFLNRNPVEREVAGL
jgi:ATP-binding cassette subfamily C protein